MRVHPWDQTIWGRQDLLWPPLSCSQDARGSISCYWHGQQLSPHAADWSTESSLPPKQSQPIHVGSEAPARPLEINHGTWEYAWQPKRMDGNNQTLTKLKQQVMRRALKSLSGYHTAVAGLFLESTGAN